MTENDNERFMPKGARSAENVSTESKDTHAADSRQELISEAGKSEAKDSPIDTYDYFRRREEKVEAEKRDEQTASDHEAENLHTYLSNEGQSGSGGNKGNNGEHNHIDGHSYSGNGNSKSGLWWKLLLVGAVCLILGIAGGYYYKVISRPFMTAEQKQREEISRLMYDKLGSVAFLVQQEYVDELSMDTIAQMAITGLMSSLDPHSTYIPKEELQATNEELEGEFSGVGVSFLIYEDSIAVIDAIKGGPAAKVGVQAGDRIVSADGKKLSNVKITTEDVFKSLRGKDGTTVRLTVKRPSTNKTLTFDVKRGAVPVKSVDAYYLMDDGKTGYVKISSFSVNTYAETLSALAKLSAEGASQFVLDLRDNPGGFMDQASLIANEFLKSGQRIVYTKARSKENVLNIKADGSGSFQKQPVAVIINENSASASEILAGAIQDNDRGVIVGRRSYGKGLVQNQFDTPEGGALRLTVARYYTPSGRSIQKEYTLGAQDEYAEDLYNRYTHGELFSADSIKFDKTKIYKTLSGRKVYGGGGIMPDIFVPEDTSRYNSYYIKAVGNGYVPQFAFKMADAYRSLSKAVKTPAHLVRILPSDSKLLESFANYAEEKGLPAAWYYINQSAGMLLNKIRAFISRDLKDDNWFYRFYNYDDTTVKQAVEALKLKSLPKEPTVKGAPVR